MARRSQLATIDPERSEKKQPSASLETAEREATAGVPLDALALRSLRTFFLLLDEWDRTMHDDSQGSSDESEIAVDSKPS